MAYPIGSNRGEAVLAVTEIQLAGESILNVQQFSNLPILQSRRKHASLFCLVAQYSAIIGFVEIAKTHNYPTVHCRLAGRCIPSRS